MINKEARFYSPAHENVYKLFDAFLQKTIIENKVINFSKNPTENADGTLEFASLDTKFSDLLACHDDKSDTLFNKHFKWLLGLGFKEHLWSNKATAKISKKETEFLSSIFTRFVTWPNRPDFKNVDEIKESLIPFVFKTCNTYNAGCRHQLLHLCDPNRYMRAACVADKMQFITKNRHFLNDFKQPSPQFYENSQLYHRCKKPVSKNNLDDGWDTDYLNNWTEDQICYIHDQMNKTSKEVHEA